MVVSTEADAYKNPKKEKPPFVPQEKKEESEAELIPGMGTESFHFFFNFINFDFFLKFSFTLKQTSYRVEFVKNWFEIRSGLHAVIGPFVVNASVKSFWSKLKNKSV